MTPAQRAALRPAFERLHPAPDGIVWCRIQQAYVQTKPHWVQITPNEHARYQGRWEGWCAALESLGEPVGYGVFWTEPTTGERHRARLLRTTAGSAANWARLRMNNPKFAVEVHPVYRLPQGE